MSNSHVNDIIKNAVSSSLMTAFSHAGTALHDFDFLRDELDESDLSHVLIQHGENAATRKQSNVSAMGGSFQTSTRAHDNGSVNLAILRQGTDLLRNFPELYNISNAIDFDFSGLTDSIKSYTGGKINSAEIDLASATVASTMSNDLDYSLENGAAEGNLRAPQHADGRYITSAEKPAYEEEHSICLAPLVEEQAGVYNEAAEMIAFEQKLADPAQRAALTASDVPLSLLNGIRDERKSEFWATSEGERYEAFDKLAESMGFEATDDLTAYQVYSQQLGSVDLDTVTKMNEGIISINNALESDFDAEWDSNLEAHAQTALDGTLDTIAQNGGNYIPQFSVDTDKLEKLKGGIKTFEANNLDKLSAPLIKDDMTAPASASDTINVAATVTPPEAIAKYEGFSGP